MTPIATKNGSIIVKDGKLAEGCGCCGLLCPCVQEITPDNLIVDVLSETHSRQYSLHQVAESGNILYTVGATYYNQCMHWEFGAFGVTSSWVAVRLLLRIDEAPNPAPTGLDDYRLQQCRAKVASCLCVLQIDAYQEISAGLVYDWRGTTIFPLSNTTSPAASLVGFITPVDFFRSQVIGGVLNDGLVSGAFAIIGQE